MTYDAKYVLLYYKTYKINCIMVNFADTSCVVRFVPLTLPAAIFILITFCAAVSARYSYKILQDNDCANAR